MKEYVEAGRIVNTHGVTGEVKIEVWLDSPEFFRSFKRLFLGGETSPGAMFTLLCRFLRRRAVARLLHGTDDFIPAGCSLHSHGVGKQAHAAGRYAGHFGDRFLHSGLTGRTAHSRDDILFQFSSSIPWIMKLPFCG